MNLLVTSFSLQFIRDILAYAANPANHQCIIPRFPSEGTCLVRVSSLGPYHSWQHGPQRHREDGIIIGGRPLMCLSDRKCDTADGGPHSFFWDWMCSRTRHRSRVNQKELHSCQSPLLQLSGGKYPPNSEHKHTQIHDLCMCVFFNRDECLSSRIEGADVAVLDLCADVISMIRS